MPPRLSPVIAGPSSSRLAAIASTSAPVKRSRKRSRHKHNLPYEGEDEEELQQQASSSRWIADDGKDSINFHSWPSYDGQGGRPGSGSSASSHLYHQRSDDDANLYDVVARIATSVIQERQQGQQQQQQRRPQGARERLPSGGRDGARRSTNNSGGGSDDNSSDSEASSSSSSQCTGNGSDDGAQDTESDDDVDDNDDDQHKASATAFTSTSDPTSALIDPLVLSIQSGLETLLASLERRRQRQQEAQGSIGSKRRVSVMSGEDVLEALQTLVGDQHGRMRGPRDGRAEAVGGREVLEAVRERVVRRRREMSRRDEAELGEEETRAAVALSASQVEASEGHPGGEAGEDEGGHGGQDITAADTSQSQQHPPQHPANSNPAPASRPRRPPSSKQPAAAATWFGDESVKSRKRRLDALLLLG